MIKKLIDILKRNDAGDLCGQNLSCDYKCETCPYENETLLAELIAELEEATQ